MDVFAALFYQPGIDSLTFMIRLCAACILGGLVGFERGLHNQAMGIRTHILISMSSCLLMGVGLFMAQSSASDPTRIAAQIVSGIGFLGAGAIMHWGVDVKGLTTAASIWTTAAIGMAVGAGLYVPALVVTVLVLWVLRFLAPLSHRMSNRYVQALVMIHGLNLHLKIPAVHAALGEFGIKAGPPAVDIQYQTGQSSLRIHVQAPHDLDTGRLLEALSLLEGIEKVGVEMLK